MNSFHLTFTHAAYLHQQLKKAKSYISKLNSQSLVSHEKQIVQRLVSLYKLLGYIKKYANNNKHEAIYQKGLKDRRQNMQYYFKARADINLPDFQKDGNQFEEKLKQKIFESEELWVQALLQIKIAIECSFINRHKFSKVAYLLVRFVEDKSKISLRHYLNNKKNELNPISRLNNIIKQNDDYGCYNRNSFSQYIRKWSNCLSVQNILRIISQSQNISSQLLNKMLINIRQTKDDPCWEYTPSVCSNFYKCWNCISFFYQKSQIQSHLNCKNNYSDPVFFISDQEAENILQNINSNLLEEMYCRAANLQNGVILMGLNKRRLVDRIHNSNTNTESDIINNLLLKHREEKLLNEKIYQVVGVQLQVDRATTSKRLESLLKSYSTNKELTQKTIQEHKIEFIPVYKAKLGRREAKLQNKKFVIKISLSFKSIQNCKLIYSRLQNVGFKQFHVFGQQLGNDSIEGRNLAYDRQQVDKKTNKKVGIYQNKLYGSDVYNEILNNWQKSKNQKQKKKRLEEFIQGFLENIDVEEREQVEKNIYKRHGHGLKMGDSLSAQTNQGSFCRLANYPVKCIKIEDQHGQQEQKKNGSKQKIISFHYADGQVQQNRDYYNNFYSYNYSYYQSSYEEQQYQQQVPINPKYGLFYEEPFAQQPTLCQSQVSKANEHIFGQIPSLVYSHTSILILSEKGRQEGLFEKFQHSLKNMNATYKISANVYEKLPCTSSRHSLVISHNNKFEVLKQRMQIAVGQSKQIKLFNVKKQMMLLSQNKSKVSSAIEQLKMKFSLMFQTKFMYGFLDDKCVFKFEEKKQAVFAFILLQCLETKCIFVNEGKIQGIQLYTT